MKESSREGVLKHCLKHPPTNKGTAALGGNQVLKNPECSPDQMHASITCHAGKCAVSLSPIPSSEEGGSAVRRGKKPDGRCLGAYGGGEHGVLGAWLCPYGCSWAPDPAHSPSWTLLPCRSHPSRAPASPWPFKR